VALIGALGTLMPGRLALNEAARLAVAARDRDPGVAGRRAREGVNSEMRRAIVTLAIGDGYLQNYRHSCQEGWNRYARKHDLDVVVITEPIDDSPRAKSRSPAWQKCLILSHKDIERYDQVVWIDSDVLINPSSPNVFGEVPIEKIGAVDAYATPSQEDHPMNLEMAREHWHKEGVEFSRSSSATEYHRNFGLEGKFQSVVQTGVLVLSPKHHCTLLERVYSEYEDKGKSCWHYEMRPLSYEILKADLACWISPKFNMIWQFIRDTRYPFLGSPEGSIEMAVRRMLKMIRLIPKSSSLRMKCATTAFLNSYFLHFAGSSWQMRWVNQTANSLLEV